MSEVKNLYYRVGNFELNIPHWSFKDEGISTLTGVSGSGKSTIIKILCGLIPCPSLYWEFRGQDMALLSPPERNLGVCFQDLRLFPHLSAQENILFALTARGFSLKEKQKDFEDIVNFLELKKCLDLFIEELSGGEKQRTALARALIVKPKLLFLDEPFSYLDKGNKEKARFLTKELVKQYALPLLLVSHDLEDIQALSSEQFVLEKGNIFKRN